MDTYRRGRVFERLLSLYSSSYLPREHKRQIINLVAQAAAIADGGMTLVTRAGILSWLYGQSSREASGSDVSLRKVIDELWRSCGKERIKAWSRGLGSCDV
jgi:nucleolar pre-ribosomal-associated protein 1